MGFQLMKENWLRDEYFEHYLNHVPCTFSITVKSDITAIITSEKKLYPTMLYYLTTIVNRHQEFRMSFNKAGQLGFFDKMIPCYTIFHKESETFSSLWTKYSSDFDVFCEAYEKDVKLYGNIKKRIGKPNMPEYCFPVSMIPWVSFEGFNLNLQKGYDYLTPIFTMGRHYKEMGKIILPLSVQVHHAVCDGYHVSRFINELQELIYDHESSNK